MEKPVTVDGPGSRKMLELAQKSVEKNMKVCVGLMCRHCVARQNCMTYPSWRDRRHHPDARLSYGRPDGLGCRPQNPENQSELMYQISNFHHAYLWRAEAFQRLPDPQHIDECCWMKEAWPVEAKGTGGRHYRNNYVDQKLRQLLGRIHL